MCFGRRDRTGSAMRTRFTIVLFTLALIAPAVADPFSDLSKTGACFHRTYDAGHLKKIPRQQFTSMTVWIKGDAEETRQGSGNVGLGLTRRGDPQALLLAAGCEWSEFKTAPDWMKTFKKKAGAGCITSAVPDVFRDVSSAEEGGAVVLDPSADGKTMTVHLDDGQVMVKRADRGRKISVKLGDDDRVFLLRRTDAKACESVKDAVTTLEPESGKR